MLFKELVNSVKKGLFWIILLSSLLAALANAAYADSTPPTTPTGVTATAGPSPNVFISWNHSSDPESGIKSYIILRHPYPITNANRSDARKVAEVSGNVNSYTDNTGITGETYYYAVVAINGVGLASGVSSNAVVTVAGMTDPHSVYSRSTNHCRTCHRVHNASANEKLYRKATQKKFATPATMEREATSTSEVHLEKQRLAVPPRFPTIQCREQYLQEGPSSVLTATVRIYWTALHILLPRTLLRTPQRNLGCRAEPLACFERSAQKHTCFPRPLAISARWWRHFS